MRMYKTDEEPPAGVSLLPPESAVSTDRRVFLRWLLESLSSESYVLLKYILPSIDVLGDSSDLDLLVTEEALDRIMLRIEGGPGVERVSRICRHHMRMVRVFFADGGFLQVDLLHRFSRKGIVFLDEQRVLASAHPDAEGWKVPGTTESFEYIMLFYMLNDAEVPLRYQRYFGGLTEAQRAAVLAHVRQHYGLSAQRMDELFVTPGRWKGQVRCVVSGYRPNRLSARIRRTWGYLGDVVSLRRRAPMITFSGVDGVGKSTIMDDVEKELRETYRLKVVRLRHRPGLLPILSTLKHGKAEAERRTTEQLPRTGGNRSFLSSILRFAYYLADYLVGQQLVHLRYLSKGTVVLYDRYYFDFVADPERSNIRLPRWITGFFYRFVARPDLSVLLYAHPERILARKQELAREAVEELTSRYDQLFEELAAGRYPGRYVRIENGDQRETRRQVVSLIRDTL
jgi:thymidylate kinase